MASGPFQALQGQVTGDSVPACWAGVVPGNPSFPPGVSYSSRWQEPTCEASFSALRGVWVPDLGTQGTP